MTAVANGAESAASNEATATPAVGSGSGSPSNTSGGSVPPAATATRKFWLDANQLTGLTDSGYVSYWPDADGNGTSLSQSTATEQPTYRTNVLNGRPVVRFDASDDGLSGGPGVTGPAWAMFVVLIPGAAYNARAVQDGSHNLFVGVGGDGHWDFYAARGISNSAGPTVVAGTPTCLTIRYDGSTSSFRVNGVDHTGDSGSAQPPAALALGASGYVTNQPWGGDVAEVILYDGSVTDAQRASIESYLSTKWGLGF